MTAALKIPADGALDFLALGALVHRLDPGIIPFRKAQACAVHVSGGEFNCAANLADAFGMRTAIATAMVKYPIGDLIAGQVRAMGVTPLTRCSSTTACADPIWRRSTAIAVSASAVRRSSTTAATKRQPSSSLATSTGAPSSPVASAGFTVAASSQPCPSPPQS